MTNSANRTLTVSLEPLGYYHELRPGETRNVTYAVDDKPHLEIGVDDDGISIWDETDAAGDGLVFEAKATTAPRDHRTAARSGLNSTPRYWTG